MLNVHPLYVHVHARRAHVAPGRDTRDAPGHTHAEKWAHATNHGTRPLRSSLPVDGCRHACAPKCCIPPPSRLLPPRVVALACCRHKDLRGTCEKMSTRESCGAQVLAAPEAACTSKLVSTQLQRPACGDIVVTAGGSSSRAEMSACCRDRGCAQHGAPSRMCMTRARVRRLLLEGSAGI